MLKNANIKCIANLFNGATVVTFRQTDRPDESNKQIVGIFRCESAKDKWLRNNGTTRSSSSSNNNNNNNNPNTYIIPIYKCKSL